MNRDNSKQRFGTATADYFQALETLEAIEPDAPPEHIRRAERNEYIAWRRFAAKRKQYREAILESLGQ
jgi:hypothetical protein